MPDETNKSKSEQPDADESEQHLSGNEHQMEGEARGHNAKNVPWWLDQKLETKQVGEKHGDHDSQR